MIWRSHNHNLLRTNNGLLSNLYVCQEVIFNAEILQFWPWFLSSRNVENIIALCYIYLEHNFVQVKVLRALKSWNSWASFRKRLKPQCWEPPGHYLCTPEPSRPGCIISIQIGVKHVNATSAEKRLERKWSFPLYISPRRGLKADEWGEQTVLIVHWWWPPSLVTAWKLFFSTFFFHHV